MTFDVEHGTVSMEDKTMVYHKFFMAGRRILKGTHEAIARGLTHKHIRCPDGQPGVPMCVMTDYLMTDNDIALDLSDPVLKEALEAVGLPIEKTYIIFDYNRDSDDPLSRSVKVRLYGWW